MLSEGLGTYHILADKTILSLEMNILDKTANCICLNRMKGASHYRFVFAISIKVLIPKTFCLMKAPHAVS